MCYDHLSCDDIVESIEVDILTLFITHHYHNWPVTKDRQRLPMVKIIPNIKDPAQPKTTGYISINNI